MSMSKWREYAISDLGKIGRGKSKHRPRNDQILYGGQYPFIQTGDVKAANFYINKHKDTYNEKGLAQSKLWDKGTLCITIAANIADTAILKYPACFPDSIIGFTPYQNKADVRFVKYYFDIYKKHMEVISMGATQNNLSIKKLESLKFIFPDLKTQEKIADILSTYDELIENNNRRIEILERIAEEIYKEWFVRMRFPGHENTKFEKGIPIGWEVKKVGDIIDKLESGRRPKNSLPEDKMIVSLGAGDIKGVGEYSNNNEYLIPYSFFKELSRGRVENKDIAVYKDGAYTGKVTMFRDDFPYKELAINEHVFLVRCKDQKMQNYLLFTLKQNSYYELIQILSMTSAQPGINQSKFRNIKIEIPSDELIERFDCLTETCLKEIFNLAKQNQNLIKQRDLLLPRLMNGTIEVN